jgi:hypothetical protein
MRDTQRDVYGPQRPGSCGSGIVAAIERSEKWKTKLIPRFTELRTASSVKATSMASIDIAGCQ